MQKNLLSCFILSFIFTLVALAAEKPQLVAQKPGLPLKEKYETYNPVKQFQDFKGVYGKSSNPISDNISLNEGFEDPAFPPAGWHTKNILGGVQWMRASSIVHSGIGSAIIAWETTGGEDWLVTPQLTIEAGDSLSFWTRKFWPAIYEPDSLEIRISTTDTSVASFTTVLASYDVNAFSNPSFGEHKIDLNAFAGQNVYIAFRHFDTNGNGMYLDDVVVGSATIAPVMNTLYSELIAPPTLVGNSVSDTFGIVANFGGSDLTISSITLTNSDFAVNPISGTVSPGDTLFVEASFTPSLAGTITGLMIISGNDPANPSDTIQVSGLGYQSNYVLEEFNDFPYYPYNFSRIDANADSVEWEWYLLTSAGDSNLVAGITYAGAGNDDYLVTPPIPVVSGDFISFDAWAYSASYPETWQVLVSTTDNQATSFTVGLDTVTSGITSPVRYTYDLSAFAGQTIYVAIRNVSVDMYYQFVDNVVMPIPNYPTFINEIYYDSPGADVGTFTEIFGKPGLNLTGYMLDGINGNGGASYRQIDLSGNVIPADGFFVVGQDNTVPNVDFIADVNWQNGPDNVLLIHGADTLDAIGYGDFSSAVFAGEGNPVPEPFVNYGLARYPDGFDTNDNAADFYPNYLSAGEPNYVPLGIIGGGSSLDFDTVAIGVQDTLSFTIYNNGGTGLHVSSIITSNPVFTAEWPDGATDTTIAFGSSADLNVIFAPTAGVTYNDSMTIITNDLFNSSKIVYLTGTGELTAPVPYFDDFEAYTAGTQLVLQNPTDWTTWSGLPGSGEDPFVSNNFAYSGNNSVVIAQNNDLVKTFGQLTSGAYKITFQVYIPTGKAGYFNTLAGFTPNPFMWGMEVFFDVGGGGRLNGGATNAATFTYAYNTWQPVEVIVDLDNDLAEFSFDSAVIHTWQWTLGATGGGGSPLQLDANDFFGATADDEMYIDDYHVRADSTHLTAIDDNGSQIPMAYSLYQNYPNPFNPTTEIRFALAERGLVKIKIYDLLGREVKTLVNERKASGSYTVLWDGTNHAGQPVASGVYIYRLSAGEHFVQSRKMLLLR